VTSLYLPGERPCGACGPCRGPGPGFATQHVCVAVMAERRARHRARCREVSVGGGSVQHVAAGVDPAASNRAGGEPARSVE
jgi:hypothetical protein